MEYSEVWKAVKFALVGCLTVVVYFSLWHLLSFFVQSTIVLAAASYVGSTLINYMMQRRITFASKLKHSVSLYRYLVVQLLAITINCVLMFLLVDIAKVGVYVAGLTAIAVVATINFLLSRFWVFADR